MSPNNMPNQLLMCQEDISNEELYQIYLEEKTI